MTKLTILALTAVAASAFAGHEIAAPVKHSKAVIPQEACFGETELQFDIYGAHVDGGGVLGEGFGGGIAATYFFHRNFGVTLDGNITNSNVDDIWQASAGLVARYPFEIGGVCLSPYVKVTGGVQSENGTNPFLGLGGGLEWRITPRVGLFGEATYGFVEDQDDMLNLRAGVRFVF